MIKILHVTKRFPPYIGGIESLTYDTCVALKDKYDQKVFAYNDKNETIEENYKGIDVIRVAVNAVVASQPIAPSYGKLLTKTIREYQPDIIHFDYPNPYGAYHLLRAIKKTNWHGKFLLFWVADIIKQKMLEPFFRKQSITLINMADIVEVLSPAYLKDTSYLPRFEKDYRVLAPRIGDSRLNVTDEQRKKAEEIRASYGDKTICFFFGRHVPYKGVSYLIEANKYLNRDDFQIIIGGKGPLTDKLKEEA